MVLNTLFCLASLDQPAASCVPSWLLVKINAVLAEPRTSSLPEKILIKPNFIL